MPECSKPKDQGRINKAKKEFMEKRRKGGETGVIPLRKEYSCGKFGRPGPKDNGVKKINNVWHCFCGKCDSWNQSHTTKYHTKWLKDPSGFKLGKSHPYALAVNGRSVGESTPTPTTSTSNTANKSASANLFTKIHAKCSELETTLYDLNLAQMDGFFKALFSHLNK